jgi:hypothetical protein
LAQPHVGPYSGDACGLGHYPTLKAGDTFHMNKLIDMG